MGALRNSRNGNKVLVYKVKGNKIVVFFILLMHFL